MRRALPILLAAGLLVALPATASAAGWKGVVVAKDVKRGTVVTASARGKIRTLRAPAKARTLAVGQRVDVKARPLADGTFAARSVRVLGRAARATIRAAVVRHQARLGRTILSAGESAFAVRTSPGRALSAASDGLAPGDVIVAVVDVTGGELEAEHVEEVDHAEALELEGIVTGVSRAGLDLAVVHRGLVRVGVPAGFLLPALEPGDEVEAVVAVGEGGALTLMALERENRGHGSHDDDEFDLDDDGDELEVKGTVTSLADTSVSVGSVTCGFAAGTALGVEVGDFVELECRNDGPGWMLARIHLEDDEADDDEEGELDDEYGEVDGDHEDDDDLDEDEDGEDHSGPGSGDGGGHED
jgi:hypothetical protein